MIHVQTVNLRFLLPVLLFMVLGSGVSRAQQLDLLQAFQFAEENNPQLLAARQQRRGQLEQVPQARSQLFPQITASGSANRVWEDMQIDEPPMEMQGGFPLEALGGERTYNTVSASLDITQAIYRREAFIALRQARVIEDEAELNFELARQQLLLQVAEAYFGVLEAEDAVRTAQAEHRAVEQEFDRAQRRRELGVGAITEVNDTRARHSATRAALLRAQSQLRLARQTLQRRINAPVNQVTGLGDEFAPNPPQPASARDWAELAQQQSRQVRAAELALQVAKAGVDAARAQRHPRVDLVGRLRHDRQGANPTFGGVGMETDGASIGVQVSMPLFLGGGISAQVRQRSAEREATYQQLLDAKLEAGLNAESAFTTLADTVEQIQALQEALEAAQTAEESTQRSMELGQRTTLDLLNVQRELYQVERDLAAARYQYLLAYLQLRLAVGHPVEDVLETVWRQMEN